MSTQGFSHITFVLAQQPPNIQWASLFSHYSRNISLSNHLKSHEPPTFRVAALAPRFGHQVGGALHRLLATPCDLGGCVRCFAQAKIALKLGFHSRFQTILMGVEGHDECNRMVGLKLGKGRRANTSVPQLDFFGFCRVVFLFRYHQGLLLLFQYLRLYSCSIYPTEPGAMVCIQAAQCKIPIRNGITQLLTRFTSCGVDLDELVIGGFYKFLKTVNGSSRPLAFQPGNIKEYSPN